jgi:hypothetical protein
MKYIKLLGLLAVAAAALMAFASTASATLTGGTEISAESSHFLLTGSLSFTCKKSTFDVAVTTSHPNHTSGPVTNLKFEECGKDTIDVLSYGTFTMTDSDGTTGSLYLTGAEITVLTHRPLIETVHCIYKTTNTYIGTFTESHHDPGPGSYSKATFHFNSVSLERVSTSFGCGTHATWDGTYEITAPATLALD